MRRALEYAVGLGVTLAQHCEDDGARRAAATCTRASGRAGSASPASPAEAEELMVMRDIALARLTGAPRALPAPVDRAARSRMVRAAKADGLPVTAEATPHHFTLTDAECASLRPGVQGEPAAAHRRRRRRGQRRAGRRHDRRHRHRPRAAHARRPRSSRSTRRRRGCSASRPRSALALTELVEPCLTRAEVLGAAVVAAGARSPGSTAEHGGPIAAGRARQPLRDRPGGARGWSTRPRWRAAAATRPYAGRKLTGRVRHTILRGEPVVIDGEAQR